MENLVYRIAAGLFVVLGGGLFGYMMQATYATSREWDHRLFAIGMPLSFLLPAIAALMVAVGCAMFAHLRHEGRRR